MKDHRTASYQIFLVRDHDAALLLAQGMAAEAIGGPGSKLLYDETTYGPIGTDAHIPPIYHDAQGDDFAEGRWYFALGRIDDGRGEYVIQVV